jgi:hypothetical protein
MSPDAAGRPTVFLHIGPPKTGTSYLQDTLGAWQQELLETGVLYPGDPANIHFLAALDARGNVAHGIQAGEDDADRAHAVGAWSRIVATARAFGKTTVISHEIFASADDEHAAAAVHDLDGTDLHLVLTARDPARQIMSAWQQRVRQGSTRPFATVASTLRRRGTLAPGQDVARLLHVWGRDLSPDHVHVVTVPPSGSDPTILWKRFASVVGIDAARFDTSRTERSNEALGWAELETLRRVNVALDGRISQPYFSEVVSQFFAREVMTGLATSSKAALPQDLRPLADNIAQVWTDTIRTAGYDVVGDLDDLCPRPPDGGSSRPNDAAIAQAAVKASAELLVELAEQKAASRADQSTGATAALKRTAARARRGLLGPRARESED